MKLKFKNGHFFTICKYEERNLPRDAGFKWHEKYKVWHTKDPFAALQLAEYAEFCAYDQLSTLIARIERSKATDSPLIIPVPEGRHYLPYQIAGVEWCAPRRFSLIADEMGLGKTIQAIALANYVSAKQMLVICPASVKLNWALEIMRWHVLKPSIHVVKSGTEYFPSAAVIIINYDLLLRPHIQRQLMERKYELVILDEAHYLKNPEAKRTRAVLSDPGILRRAQRAVALTGTPIVNKPIEFYPILAAMSPETIRPYDKFWDYARRFCGAYQGAYGYELGGAAHKEELNLRLRSTFMIRRLKKDVLKDLPEKQYQIITFEESKATGKLLKVEREAIKKLHFNKLGKMTLEGLELGELAEIRQEMALAKLKDCVEHIEDVLENGVEKVVVFAHHKSVVGELELQLRKYGAVTLSGETSQPNRQKAIEDFQNKNSIRVFIGNIQAAGVGITLTAANHVVFVESSWVPGENEQAIDRCHRIGQKNNVLAQFLVVKGGLDEYILRRALEKKEIIDQILT